MLEGGGAKLVGILRVVEWRPGHQDDLDRVLGPPDLLCGQARSIFGTPGDGSRWRFTLVAELGGEPAGAAVVFAPRWHAQRLWVSVEVGAAYRRQGVGTVLLDAVRTRCRADGRPLRAKVFSPSAAADFAAERGFTVIQRSRTFRLEERASGPHADFSVEAPAAPEAAAVAFRSFYLSSHRWDPPGTMTADDIAHTHVAEAEATIIVRGQGGEALAVGCLYGEGDLLTLSGGPTDPAHPDVDAATGTLLDSAPRPLMVEADDSVPVLVAALMFRGATVVNEVHIVAEA